jgi:RNA polymerase sigma-70 factor (ECF subfamily)
MGAGLPSVERQSVNKTWPQGILNWKFPIMARPAGSALEIQTWGAARAERPSRPSALEEEVTQLFDQLRSPLLRYVLAMGLAAADAEEVIQEVFLSLFQHLRRGKSRQNLRGWVFRVAHNQALKLRYAQRGSALAAPEGEYQPADPDPNPEEALASRQRRERLLAVVRALPEQDRWCLNLRAEGLRYREIAQVVGMSLGAVSLSLTRSLGRLSRADGG